MAIDRAPWNALIDDDGSNLVGSIWNKAAIKTVLLDPIDASLDPIGTWQNVPFSAGNFAGITVTAGQVPINRYSKFAKTLIWSLAIENATCVGSPGSIQLAVPFFVPLVGGTYVVEMLAAGAWVAGRAQVGGGSSVLNITQFSYAALSGAFYLHFTLMIEVS